MQQTNTVQSVSLQEIHLFAPSVEQRFQLRHGDAAIDLREVPTISGLSKKILADLGAQIPPFFNDPAPLINQIESIERIKKELRESRTNATCRKTSGMLKTASSTSLITGSIVGLTLGGPIGLGTGITGLLLHMACSLHCWNSGLKKIQEIEQVLPNASQSCWLACSKIGDPESSWADLFIAAIGPGTILPAYEAFSRESRAERILNELETALADMLNASEAAHLQRLPAILTFCEKSFPNLLNTLNEKIEEMQKNLASMEQFTQRILHGENNLKALIVNFSRAKNELETAVKFYQQLT